MNLFRVLSVKQDQGRLDNLGTEGAASLRDMRWGTYALGNALASNWWSCGAMAVVDVVDSGRLVGVE